MNVCEYKTRLDEERYPYIAEAAKYQYGGQKITLHCPESVARFIGEEVGLKYDAEERFYALAFNTRRQLVGLMEISHGTLDQSIVSPREVYQKLLMLGAAAWVGAHNHPSGDPTPSSHDHAITKRLVEAGKMLDVKMLDHIIVGDGYYSFMQQGEMPE